MQNMTRREFAKKSALICAGIAGSKYIGAKEVFAVSGEKLSVTIPMPIQVVIDDVGWWSGEDGSKLQQPYRTGINRNHVPADYQAIADLGKKLGIRPQAATILSEWDRENILRDVPTSTWMREKWDNSKWVGPWLDEAADIIRNNRDHYELTLHGLGHEYWEDENFTRAEWADPSGQMRPLDQVEIHLDYFAKIMDQNGLGGFPTSFVPTAFRHGFGPTGNNKVSMAGVLKKRGIKYINTPFNDMYNAEAVQFGLFGIDDGVITVDRGRDLFNWNKFGGKPQGVINGPTCGMHWPNLLHEDPDRNSEVVDAWAEFLKPYNDKPNTILAADSGAYVKQLLHMSAAKVQLIGNTVELNFTEVDKLMEDVNRDELVIKVSSPGVLDFNADSIKISSTDIFTDGDVNLYTLKLKRLPGYSKVVINFIAV